MGSLQDSSNLVQDNSEKRGTKRNFRNIQPISFSEPTPKKRAHKENYRHIFHHDSPKQSSMKKLVSHTFTTKDHKAEPTRSSRPTMGGKTIGSIHKSEPMSSQELKLLSRRINPHEPLPSPHASPRKPPLPNIKQARLFRCEPCSKQYKTRNGLTYHLERCPSNKIDCICSDEKKRGAVIECTSCHIWLHMSCIGQVREEDYICPRCLPKEVVEEKKEVEEEEEDALDLGSLFTDDAFHAFMDEQTSGWDSEFNSVDWYNTTDIPSLLLSDNGLMDSTSELQSSSNMPSSPLSELDWLNFTNFDNELIPNDS
ncbi:hypothetical protein G6F56_012117 [Rhizopus delemar]|nr:hypothetical protein G6F56_012117 [Rhizopus delemar]